MSRAGIRIGGAVVATLYAVLIVWLYGHHPGRLSEVSADLAATLGVYHIDEVAFGDGLRYFKADKFVEARAAFERADPAQRDARTQFYIAYTYCRQGWGRIYHDDTLYQSGVTYVDRAIALAPDGRLVVDDPDLVLKSADELKAELERGRTRELSDLNPLKILRTRP